MRSTRAVGALGLGLAAAVMLARRRRPASLSGEVALVTGGSRGLGYLLARDLLREGCRVAICGRDPDALQRAAERLGRSGPVLTVTCDVSDAAAVRRMVAEVEDTLGPIDILLNVAAIIQVGPLDSQRRADFERALGANFWGVVNASLAVLPGMRGRGYGRILTITSIGGKVSVPHLLPYSCGKFAAVAFSEGLAAELAGTGVRITTVVPGLMRTGSPLNVPFRGQKVPEATWFTASDLSPLSAMSAERAAARVITALKRGETEVTLSWQAKLLRTAHGVAPGLVVDALGVVNRLLPDAPAGAPDGGQARGHELRPRLPTTWLRERLAEAGARTNQRPPGEPGGAGGSTA